MPKPTPIPTSQTSQAQASISALQAQIDAHIAERQGLRDALAAIAPTGRDPAQTIAAAQKRAALDAQIAALDQAIAVLTNDLEQAQAVLTQAQEQAEIEAEAAFLAEGMGLGMALAQEGAELTARLADWIERVGATLGAYNEAHRSKLRRALPPIEEYALEGHANSAFQRYWDAVRAVNAHAFLEGVGRWYLPALVQVDDHFELQQKKIDICPPKPFFRTNPSAGGGGGGHKTLDELIHKPLAHLTPAQREALTPAQRSLIRQGFTGPQPQPQAPVE